VGNVSGHPLVAESKSLRQILPQNTKLSGTRGDLHCLPRKWGRRRGFAARLTHFHWVQSRNLCWYLVLGDTRNYFLEDGEPSCRLGTSHFSFKVTSKFDQLVRFQSPSGRIFYSELSIQSTAPTKEDLSGRKIRVYQEGKLPWDEQLKLTEVEEEIAEVRASYSRLPNRTLTLSI
jgi:hypothetical protein